MNMIQLSAKWVGMPAAYLEGALLAANLSPAPLAPDTWFELLTANTPNETSDEGFIEDESQAITTEDRRAILSHLEQQHLLLMRNEYQLPSALINSPTLDLTVTKAHKNFAEGFLALWPYVEPAWQNTSITDGTKRMLSALVTCILLLQDEEETLKQLSEAGLGALPKLSVLYSQFDLMVNEVAQAANDNIMGQKASAVNPFKTLGRNDPCLCGSLKKFKKCCGEV